MDYTLAVYKQPEFDTLVYACVVKRLGEMGYSLPEKVFTYDPGFAIRGLLVDKQLGNLLKVSKFGEILTCYHGFRRYKKSEMVESYPNLQVREEDIGKRFDSLDTLFSMSETCLFAQMVEHFDDSEKLELSFEHLWGDVRETVDWVHRSGVLKTKVMEDLPRYVYRQSDRLASLLSRMRARGSKTFLLTNSEYYYTKAVMSYLLDGAKHPEGYSTWLDYFDVKITSARKPSFFGSGTTFREVDAATGHLKIGRHIDSFAQDTVYSGGSLPLFNQLTGAAGTNVLYIGDHIFADIQKSKTTTFWRTLLVVPEVSVEVDAELLDKSRVLHTHLRNLTFIKNETFRGLDADVTQAPDVSHIRAEMKETVARMDELYNRYWGSPFRSGAEETFFAHQVQRFADLYAGDFLNLLNYPLFYHFGGQASYLPHEKVDELLQAVEDRRMEEETPCSD
jgi:5'-nucleotidase